MGVTSQLLKHPRLYQLSQYAIGGHWLRHLCIDKADLKDGDCVLDVGCGPAYYFDRLPKVRYFGFDTDATYIRWARKHFGHRGQFFCELYAEKHLRELPKFKVVFLMGLLHHIDDAQADELLRLAGRSLEPGGRVISLDSCWHPRQSKLAHWLSKKDRGLHVRDADAFLKLAGRRFRSISDEYVGDQSIVVLGQYLMSMSGPHES